MRRRLAFLVALAALAGCASVADLDHEQCVGYGFTRGSEAYGNCRLQLDIARDQRITTILAAPTGNRPRF